MDLIHELGIMRLEGVVESKGFDLRPYLEGLHKLEQDSAVKKEVQELYLMGFTSGELLGYSTAYNSRQALFSALHTREPEYTRINKEHRGLVEEAITYYYAYTLVEDTGDLTEAERIFDNNKTRFLKYYISQGGQRDLWSEKVYSSGAYVDLIPFLTSDKSIRQVIDEINLKNKDDLTYDEQRLISLDSSQLNSLQACYGRIKKIDTMNSIYKNKSLSEIRSQHYLLDNTYKNYYNKAVNKVKQLLTKYQDEANLVQRVKYELKITGQGAAEFITGIQEEEQIAC